MPATSIYIDKTRVVYWFHHKNDKDPFTQGYIGYAVWQKMRPLRRETQHRNLARLGKQTKLYTAIRKYGNDMVYDILFYNLSLDESKKIEKFYRPVKNIGLNMLKGGGGGGDGMLNKTHSDKFKKEQSERMKKRLEDPIFRNNFCGKSGVDNNFYGKHHTLKDRKYMSSLKRDKDYCLMTFFYGDLPRSEYTPKMEKIYRRAREYFAKLRRNPEYTPPTWYYIESETINFIKQKIEFEKSK